MFRGRFMRFRGNRGMNRSRAVVISARRVLRIERGTPFVPRADPPRINQSPWYPYVLALYMTGTSVDPVRVGVNVVTDNLQLELGLYYQDDKGQKFVAPICFRVLEAKVWNISRGPVKSCFFSLIGEDFTSVQEDVQSVIHYARVGYRWSRPQQMTVFSKGRGNDDDILNVYVPNDHRFIVHLHVLWRPLKNQQYVPSIMNVVDDFQCLELSENA